MVIPSRHSVNAQLPTGAMRALWIVWVCTVPVTGAFGNDTLLSTQRWHDRSYGLSLRPPLGSRMVSQTADDALVRFYGDSGYTIRLYIKKSTIDLAIENLLSTAIHQLGGVYPSATILQQKQRAPSGMSGAVIYFRIPDQKRGPWVMGQGYVQLSNRIFAMLQVEVDLAQFEAVRELFEAIVDSIEVQNPQQLDKHRQLQIAQGQTWLKNMDPEHLRQAIEPDRWLRIIDHGVDTGYMRVQQRTDAQMGQEGVRVNIRSRMVLGSESYDSISQFFVSDNNDREFWSIRTTVRRQRNDPSTSKTMDRVHTQSWSETGIRSKDKITVSRETPSGVKEHRWQKPPLGYLSQARLHMLDQLIGHQDAKEMGFYAYHPGTQKIVYRTTRAQSVKDGSYVVYTRPSPDQDEQISSYAANGELQKRILPGGRVLVPTTIGQLRRKWKLKSFSPG